MTSILLISPTQWLLLAVITVLALAVIIVSISNHAIYRRTRQGEEQGTLREHVLTEALNISGNTVARIDLHENYIHLIHGDLLPKEGISLEKCLEHIHPDDLTKFIEFNKDMSSGESKIAECDYRWNLDYTGTKPDWANIHSLAVSEFLDNSNLPDNIICTFFNETEARRQQQRDRELSEKYRLIFEHSIIGLAFFDANGQVIDTNENMRKTLHYDGPAQDFLCDTSIFDIYPLRGNVDKHHLEEFWVCTKSEHPYKGKYEYMEVRLHPIHDEKGNLIYIAMAVRDVTKEREMYLQVKLNDQQMRQINEEIQRYETELKYLMEACDMRVWRTDFEKREIVFYKGLQDYELKMSFEEFETYFVDDSGVIAENFRHPELHFTKPVAYICQMRPIFHDTEELQWNQLNNVPVYDNNGKLTGCFGIIRNIQYLMEKQEALKRETERANDSGRLKSVFLANMTHEIRTPLNAIVGFSDLLQSMESSEEKRELIRIIHNNCDMLLRLINDILAISSMDTNGLIMNIEEVDFAQAFDDICQTLAQRVENPAVKFIKDNPYTRLDTELDQGRVQQVITNFVTNAVKYTQQGHIKVGYRVENDGLYIYCEDTGAGIPEAQREKVFERFVKLNDYVQGTGLGLSICKAIAERCRGRIGVDSEVGHGSTFWVWIPCNIEEITRKDED